MSWPHSFTCTCASAKLPGTLHQPSELPHFHLANLVQNIFCGPCKSRIVQKRQNTKEKHLSHLRYNDFYSDMIKPLLNKEEDFCILFYAPGAFP